jgi:hypothetical protein
MAKLAQVTDWVSGAIGDGPRARSLMLVSRKEGIFPTGGRGKGAPDMTAKDAANATLLALFDGPTVQSAVALKEMGSLPLAALEVCPHGPREPERIALNENFGSFNGPLPSHFNALPENLLDALTCVFAHSDLPYHMCQISVSKSALTLVEVTIFDPDLDIESDLCSETDFYCITLKFSDLSVAGGNGLHQVNSNRWLTGHGLGDLYCLINGVTEADLEARDQSILDATYGGGV